MVAAGNGIKMLGHIGTDEGIVVLEEWLKGKGSRRTYRTME